MEVLLPVMLMGGMYAWAKRFGQQEQELSSSPQQQQQQQEQVVEGFSSNRAQTQVNREAHQWGGSELPPPNYPPYVDTVGGRPAAMEGLQLYEYSDPNVSTSQYLNQNAYERAERAGYPVTNHPASIYQVDTNYTTATETALGHNNMVPFDRKRPWNRILYNNDVAGDRLDSMIGLGSQDIHKTEQAPLFANQANMTWANGMPSTTEFMHSRVNPSMRQHMVKPFESIQVGPGLNKGVGSTEGSGGLNSGMEARETWLPKPIEELRVLTNPREEYNLYGHEGPALNPVKSSATVQTQGLVEHRHPDTFYVNGPERWFTTTGAEKGPRLTEMYEAPFSQRGENTVDEYKGHASYVGPPGSYTPEEYEPSKKQNMPAFSMGLGVATVPGYAPATTAQLMAAEESRRNTNRQLMEEQSQMYVGSGMTRAIGAVVAPLLDILNPTRRDECGDNGRLFGNMSTGHTQMYLPAAPGQVLAPTIKETTLGPSRMGGASMGAGMVGGGGGYLSADMTPPSQTLRETTLAENHFNPATSKLGGIMPYDAAYRQHVNELKEIPARINVGNTQVFTPQMNNVTNLKRDENRVPAWIAPPSLPIGPSTQTLGVDMKPLPQRYEDLQNTRLDGSILTAFKANPYTQFSTQWHQ